MSETIRSSISESIHPAGDRKTVEIDSLNIRVSIVKKEREVSPSNFKWDRFEPAVGQSASLEGENELTLVGSITSLPGRVRLL